MICCMCGKPAKHTSQKMPYCDAHFHSLQLENIRNSGGIVQLKIIRYELGLTQDQMADKIGVSRNVYANTEENTRAADLVFKAKLGNMLGKSPEEIDEIMRRPAKTKRCCRCHGWYKTEDYHRRMCDDCLAEIEREAEEAKKRARRRKHGPIDPRDCVPMSKRSILPDLAGCAAISQKYGISYGNLEETARHYDSLPEMLDALDTRQTTQSKEEPWRPWWLDWKRGEQA